MLQLMQRTMNMRKHGILTALVALALTACGGTEDAFQGGPGGGTPAATPASLVVTASAASIPADGSLTAEISGSSGITSGTGAYINFSAASNATARRLFANGASVPHPIGGSSAHDRSRIVAPTSAAPSLSR